MFSQSVVPDFLQVLSFDPSNSLAQAELARLDAPAAVPHHAPTAAPAAVEKMTAFKPGFLNADPSAPKPRRIQIKEESDESDPEPDMGPPPSAAAATPQAPASVAVAAAVALAPLPVPRNWHEFEKTWRTMRRNAERFDTYILALPLQDWTCIFGSMMTGVFSQLAHPFHLLSKQPNTVAVELYHIPPCASSSTFTPFFTGEALADILEATARLVCAGTATPADTLKRLQLLAALPRFKMLVMFLEAPSIACLRACIASADSEAELADAQATLRQQWGIV